MPVFFIILFVLVVAILLKARIRERTRLISIFLFFVFSMSFLGLTYGKWEYLTWRYGDEIRVALHHQLDIEQLKVLSREKTRGKVFIEDPEGNKWIYYLRKGTPGGYLIDDYKVLHSTKDDSVSQLLYWY